ncbi:NUDIX domain-containing protein [Candidatus Woesearchaeota archaeon]|nr:NUDIX domain-containing protein [Candidatus Woesearchaeota archaeon]
MSITTPLEQPREVYHGKILRVLHQKMQENQRQIEYEWAERSPGTRLIIIKDKMILLTKEYRTELKDFDVRLPGGKVFDTLDEYGVAQEKGKLFIIEHAHTAAKKEALEEAGIISHNISLFHHSKNGATVTWDLFYFIIDSFSTTTQKLESGEHIEPVWFTFEEAKKLCLEGKMKEDRSVGVLLRFLLQQT